MVPLAKNYYNADLIQDMKAEVIIATRLGLGTINHTLLSVAEIRRRKLPLEGVILVGPEHRDNRDAIEHWGGVPVVAQLPPLSDLAALAAHPATSWRP